jgi:23S rRNA (cytosine1962-C5)-methyltransferase
MQESFGKSLMFRNRLEKVYRHRGKQAKTQNITCYRVYDHDISEFPFIIEMYEDKLYVSEYKRGHSMGEEEHHKWLQECFGVMAEVLMIAPENIFVKMRQKKEGRTGQYQKTGDRKTEFIISERNLKFIVNLSDYLDTGLFLDHRITRSLVGELSRGKRMLNLFSYTGSFSVYAAAGNALSVTSVDLSKTYLAWGERNMQLNFPELTTHHCIHDDVKRYLKDIAESSVDLIVMDPPTFSNSKRMEDFLDVQKDHVELINDCMRALTDNGILFFSTNYTKFQIETEKMHASEVKDITRQTTPFDFAGKLKRQCFRLSK